ncbi:MAG: dipeptide ABC transporter ATP-binding protein [Candidatus Caldatribacteriota bacterium]
MKHILNNKILKIEKLKKYFNIGKVKNDFIYVRAVDGVDLEINYGETLGLVGESGSGKSTIAYTVVGMYYPTSGKILFKGENIGMEISRRSISSKKDIQIVFQDPGSSLNPKQTIDRILSLPLKIHTHLNKKQIQEKIIELLEKVELSTEYLYKFPPSIGGGEKQMVAIARALAPNPSLVVLDEPTSALDVSVQAKIINKLIDLQREMKLTYLFITHDLSLMRNVANRIAIMYLGKICEVAKAVTFFEKPLHPYTQMLISSVPVISQEEENLKPKKVVSIGEIPSPVNIPSGCNFHLRCPYKMPVCSKLDPEMIEISSEHLIRCHLYTK